MFYPALKRLREKSILRDSFGGLCKRPDVPEGMFSDMENLTGDSFPLLRTRNPRAMWTSTLKGDDSEYPGMPFPGHGITGVVDADGVLCICTRDYVLASGQLIPDVHLDSSVALRSLAPFGKNLYIAPEGEYIVLSADAPELIHGNFDFTCSQDSSVSVCLSDGTEVQYDYEDVFPEDAPEDSILLTKNEGTMVLYQKKDGVSVLYAQAYIGISDEGIGESFECEDMLRISDGQHIEEGRYSVEAVFPDKLLLRGVLSSVGSASGMLLKRRMPPLDMVIEHNNRLYGCRYGADADGNFVNEIYISALGRPLSWDCFRGISTDSYRASLGCSGDFTGVAVLGDDVLFFKEEYIVRVSGSTPSDFQVYSFPARGVSKADSLSVVNLNEKIFYKNRTGIMVYDGALPVNISENLGNGKYTDCVAAAYCNKYYIAMTDEKGARNIYVYDTFSGQWYKEDDSGNTRFMVRYNDCLYFCGLGKEFEVMGIPFRQYFFRVHDYTLAPEPDNIFSDASDEDYDYAYVPEKDYEWYALSGRLGCEGELENTVVRSFDLRVALGQGASFSLSILPEGETQWKRLCFIDTPCDKNVILPVSAPPCRSYRLKLQGKGDFTLFSLASRHQLSGRGKSYGH